MTFEKSLRAPLAQGAARYLSLVFAIGVFGILSSAKAQIVFPGPPTIDFSSGFLNSGTSLALNRYSGTGTPSLDGTKLELTDGGVGESRSAWYTTKVGVAKFQTQFDFQITNSRADGFTFCLQRDSTASGGGGGGNLGYARIETSVAIKFDIFGAGGAAVSTTGLYTNGAPPNDTMPPAIDVKGASGIDFHSGHVLRVLLTYVEGTLNEEITDLSTNAVFSREFTIDIPAAIGAPSNDITAYAGFTAATGAAASTQEILDWTYTSAQIGTPDVLMYRNDLASTGQYLTETALSATNVNATNFGKLFSYATDGQVYAQPLYKSAVPITTGSYAGTTHNVVFVATEHDSLYAFDADDAAGSGPLWRTSFTNPLKGITTVPADDMGSQSVAPEIGITSTPVIDPTMNTIFVCAKTKEIVSGTNHYVLRLHAIDMSSGREKPGSPTLIGNTIGTLTGSGTGTRVTAYTYVAGPTVLGAGIGSVNGRITFNAVRQHQRSALNLLNGVVYNASACEGDIHPFHGWVIGNSALNYKMVAAWNDTPDGTDGGIWSSGGGLVSDSNGDMYCITGNGTFAQPAFDSTTGAYTQGDYGDACIRLAADSVYTSSTNQNSNGWGLKVLDYFVPYNQMYMNQHDADLGSGGVLLLPDAVGSAAHPHLLVGGGKLGTVYMWDRDNLGGYNATADNVVEEQAGALRDSFDTPGYYNGQFYYCGARDVSGHAFAITSGSFAASAVTPDSYGFSGASPIITGSGGADPNAIVWCLDTGGGGGSNELRAYTASNFNNEIYTTDQAAGGRDAAGTTCKFNLPIVVNGRVYVPTASGLVVYGLLGGE